MTATRTHRTVTLLDLDGRKWTTGWFTGPADAWGWIAETVAHEWGVDEESIGCAESEDGDLVTIDGVPHYRISHFHVDKLH